MRKGRLATFLRALAWVYLAVVVVFLVALRFVGEDNWIVTVCMYFPRFPLALPLLVTVPAILYVGPRWMLAPQAVALLLVVFPLMGLELHPRTSKPRADTPKIRLLSYNIYFAREGCAQIVDEVAAHDPDVVIFQAVARRCGRLLAARFPTFHTDVSGEFVLASRFPVRDLYEPPDMGNARRTSPQYMRYTLDTPVGLIDLYNVHPYSPREGLEAARGEGLRTEIRDQVTDPHVPDGRAEIETNTWERERQVAAIAVAASASQNPVIIAGDTNLPALSHIYARFLASGAGTWKDGFAAVGNGFGYTFPAKWKWGLGPWMRIDRVLAGPGLRFLSFEIGGRETSDHCPVIAEIAAAQ